MWVGVREPVTPSLGRSIKGFLISFKECLHCVEPYGNGMEEIEDGNRNENAAWTRPPPTNVGRDRLPTRKHFTFS